MERAIFFIGSMREGMVCRHPLCRKLLSPGGRVVIPELLEGLLEQISANGLQVVVEEIACCRSDAGLIHRMEMASLKLQRNGAARQADYCAHSSLATLAFVPPHHRLLDGRLSVEHDLWARATE